MTSPTTDPSTDAATDEDRATVEVDTMDAATEDTLDIAPVDEVSTIIDPDKAALESDLGIHPVLDILPLDDVDKVNAVIDPDDEINDIEMSLFDHLEELRMRIFYAIVSIVVAIIACFAFVNKIVYLLEVPAQGVKFLQLAPGEYFFVSIKVAGYSGLLLASPVILYHIVRFVLPGLTKKEKRLVLPIVIGSSVLFVAGVVFAYIALIPAALNFFISYGGDVVEQLWSIDRYFEFVLLLLFSTGLAFQIPVVQALLGMTGIVSSQKMLSGWRYVVLGAVVLGAVLTPSTDPITQSLLAGAVGGLYFGGVGLVKLLGH